MKFFRCLTLLSLTLHFHFLFSCTVPTFRITSVGIGSNASVMASFHVDHLVKCFSHCNQQHACMGFKFKQKCTSEFEDNCILMNHIEEDETHSGDWVYYKSIMVSFILNAKK